MEKLLWIDMEMTGLNVEKEVILEVAAVVTNMNLESVESFSAILKQPQKFLDGMDDWNTKHHGESGLTAAVATGRDPRTVEDDLIALCARHWPSDRPVLAGNSISQDRLFINKHMPRLAEKLHYRMLDVTSWKILMNEKFGVRYGKQNAHRAVDDIGESIKELQLYLSHVKS